VEGTVVNRPINFNSYEFVVVSSLRAKQLLAGCTAHVDGEHTAAVKAQMEVAGGHVVRSPDDLPQPPRQCEWQL
jgi:DNA-directed RNA polymerase subunit K/omega